MKHHRLKYLSLTLLIPALLLLLWFAWVPLPTLSASSPLSASAAALKISEPLQEIINTSTEPVQFILYFKSPAAFDWQNLPADETARRTAVVDQLYTAADSSQQAVLQQLETLQTQNRVQNYRQLWIINAIAVQAQPQVIAELALSPAVERIDLDAIIGRIEPAATFTNSLQLADVTTATAASWGIPASRAPHAWYGLGIEGQGVTVGFMDSGVDWLHPALYPNYRGRQKDGSVQHAGNWYHAAVPTETEPIDYIWHGTHVAGTAVGQNGIGVAPKAKWIAVSISDRDGFLQTSAIHAAFQWLLAPHGDPTLAPDVVNNSWGGLGSSKEFLPDVQLLHLGGIITVFSAGNDGPEPQSIGYPASYTDTMAVGAYDQLDTLTWFSSRGPSLLTKQTKPLLIAPGAEIRSAYPGNSYATANGTSMAAPHVTGAIALMLSANPTLSLANVRQILQETAVPYHDTMTPSANSGWGKLDVYAAVSHSLTSGKLRGTVTADSEPVADVTVTIINANNQSFTLTTDTNGRFEAPLRAGTYTVQLSKFNYQTQTVPNIQIKGTQTNSQPITLTKHAGGRIVGQVRDSAGPISATVRLLGSDLAWETTANGRFELELPTGIHYLLITAVGHRNVTAFTVMEDEQTLNSLYTLDLAPKILLVDSAQWYYRSYIQSYQTVFDNLNYGYDLWRVHNSFDDLPTAEELAKYDMVIWSSPELGPAYLGASPALEEYLDNGGNLFIAGQDVGWYDNFAWDGELNWWHTHLRARYMTELEMAPPIEGTAAEIFDNLIIQLNGADTAQNQLNIDVAQPHANAPFTRPIFDTEVEGQSYTLGLRAGQCDPYNIVYLGFGLEGVNNQQTRNSLIAETIDYFNQPPKTVDVSWIDKSFKDFILPGSQLTYTLGVRNASELFTDTLKITAEGKGWTVDIITPTLTLGSCESGSITFSIIIPPETPLNATHALTLTAASTLNPAVADHLRIEHKTPAPVLIVDDHRWYGQRIERLGPILDELGLSYDVWITDGELIKRGSPSSELLNQYRYVLWFTAYDWYAPITGPENVALKDYLAAGGRVFLSSQDFMYYHRFTTLTQHYFGIDDYQESVTPTIAYGQPLLGLPALTTTTPISLSYLPYQNNSDALFPRPGVQTHLRHNHGVAGVANSGRATAHTQWRAIFWSLPLEVMDTAVQTDTLRNILGWLGDLGDSTFAVDTPFGVGTEVRTYTITLRNNNVQTHTVRMTNTLPAELTLLPQTLSGNGVYDAQTHTVSWVGILAPNQKKVIRYQAQPQPSLPAGTQLDNMVAIGYEEEGIILRQHAAVWLNIPQFASSYAEVSSNAPHTETTTITYTFHLNNSSSYAADEATAVLHLPYFTHSLTETLQTSAGVASLKPQQIHWRGPIPAHGTISVSLIMTATQSARAEWLISTIELRDGVSDYLHTIPQQTLLPAFTARAPIISRRR